MAFANASSTRLSVVPETAWGEIPASPAFVNLRFTSESLNAEKQTVVSDEIRPDRNVADLVQVGRSSSGSIEAELSYETFDELFASALGNDWSSDVLKNGVVQQPLSMEKTFELGATDQYHRYAGVVVDTMSLSVTAQQLITISFGVMGKGVTAGTVALSGATYEDANTNDIMSAAVDFGSLTIGGVSPSPKIMGLTIDTANNLRQQPVVGQIDLAGIGDGRFEVTGTLEAYFENGALYDAFLDHDDLELEFTLGTTTGEKYTIRVPRLKISTGTVVAGGNDEDVMVSLEWQGLYSDAGSPADDATIIITRAVA